MNTGTPIPKLCSTCRKVAVCKFYDGMVATQQSWDAQFGAKLKFPLEPESIAKTCEEYEHPTQVIKIDGDASLA